MSTKFQVGNKVRAVEASGTVYAIGDIGIVTETDTDGTVRVDWANFEQPWWTPESSVVLYTDAAAPKLTLPIVVGKKYVRRDGKVVTIEELDNIGWADAEDGSCYDAKTGSFYRGELGTFNGDLVADHIEPAKGHPHADKMAEFAEDAKETATPWDRWEMQDCNGDWLEMSFPPEWSITAQYRRRPAPTPDPHAENAADYAKDMAVSSKAWEGWQAKGPNWKEWQDLAQHPSWYVDFHYRRRPL